MTGGKQSSPMGSLSTENFHLLLICFPQKRAPCPRYVLSLFTISNAQHFPARIRAAHLASNFISLSLLEQPGLCSALPAPSGVHGNNRVLAALMLTTATESCSLGSAYLFSLVTLLGPWGPDLQHPHNPFYSQQPLGHSGEERADPFQ